MPTWATTITLRGNGTLDDDQADEVVERLEDAHGTLSVGVGEISVTLDVDTDEGRSMFVVSDAEQTVRLALLGTPAFDWPLVHAELATAEEQESRLAEPPIPELLGSAEVAALLKVSKQRLAELRARLPLPLATLASGPVWARPAIEAFDRAWTRKPGRPRLLEAIEGLDAAERHRVAVSAPVEPLHSGVTPVVSALQLGAEQAAQRANAEYVRERDSSES